MLLPAELIDHIFSFLRGDKSALKACSKAHPLCSRLAERYLYQDTVVIDTGRRWAVSMLHKRLSKNPHILLYFHTLEIAFTYSPPKSLPIVSMIPQMANLVSLSLLNRPHQNLFRESTFLPTFRNCLRQSSIKELYLDSFPDFPLAVLSNGKHIKKLVLTNCTARQESVSSPSSTYQSLKTVIIRGIRNPELLVWTWRRAIGLTSLDLRGGEWAVFPGPPTACSTSLRKLHIDVGLGFRSTYYPNRHVWINEHLEFPYTLSTLVSLEELSISAFMNTWPTANQIHCALPAIIRLVRTAPSIQTLALSFYYDIPDLSPLAQFDWSPLDRLQNNATGICPRIQLQISGESMTRALSPQRILDTLAGNKTMMGLVRRGVVSLNPGVEQ